MQSLYARIFLFRLSSSIGASKLNCPLVQRPVNVDVTGGLAPLSTVRFASMRSAAPGAGNDTHRCCTTPAAPRNSAKRRMTPTPKTQDETGMSEFLTQCAPHILDIPPYVAGRPVSDVMREFGLERSTIIKLASNENPLGMSPVARAAIVDALAEASRYPDANGHDLKRALAEAYSLDVGCITLGNGSHDLLEMAAHAVLHPGQL